MARSKRAGRGGCSVRRRAATNRKRKARRGRRSAKRGGGAGARQGKNADLPAVVMLLVYSQSCPYCQDELPKWTGIKDARKKGILWMDTAADNYESDLRELCEHFHTDAGPILKIPYVPTVCKLSEGKCEILDRKFKDEADIRSEQGRAAPAAPAKD